MVVAAPPGLTREEVLRRVERGQSNRTGDQASRSVRDILKANLLTRFNALLGSMLVVILIVGPIQDSVFGLILVFNALIGIAQELRAKMTLDRLAIVAAPRATVIRDGNTLRIPVGEVVQDDLLRLDVGDEVVVDGSLESHGPIEVNEALLTGEADAVAKRSGDPLLAGSFVTAGGGLYRATQVGEATYARRLTIEARRFQLVRSGLMRGINQILRLVTWIIVPTALLLVVSQLRANPSLADAARASVAGVITLVPEGLVLLTSASLALAVIRLGRRKVLVQQLAAVEMLARANVVCFDKTGTLTEAEIRVADVQALDREADWEGALGAIAHLDPHPNASMLALRQAYAAPLGWEAESSVPFSSDRKWAAVRFAGRGWWVVGAPDVVAPDQDGYVQGQRAMLLAQARQVDPAAGITDPRPAALVTLTESVKPSAGATLRQLEDAGVAIKIISGDHPTVVARIAGQVGLKSVEALDGRTLPASDAALAEIVTRASIFGRVKPEQKRALVRALRLAGYTVAMAGDGVNDVLALKEADIGIALGGGSTAARAVAACVLTDGSFDGVPAVLAEGRRVIANVERLASLFFTKTVYAFLLALAVGVAVFPFPFLPRQLTLVSALTIGIPSAVFTLASRFTPSPVPFLRRVLIFAIPTGFVAAAATFTAYALAVNEPDIPINEERTVATLVMASIGLWVLARLSSPLTATRRALVAAMAVGLVLAMLIPQVRAFFELDWPRPMVVFAALGIIALALGVLEVGDRLIRGARLVRPPT
ncbi:MAG TPA: HAD-IC family P-type ATPase [Candidatus Dormibacteraeota bacterium]|nr:HAD-IC family P-type ATPase [Candidatus Dormibacteraeota bacterium]